MSTSSARLARYRRIANRVRATPGEHGLRPYEVWVLLGTWSGPHTGDGDETQARDRILEGGQNPKVRFLNDEQIALSNLPKGSVDIGPITPPYPGGGTALERLNPATSVGQTEHVVLVGPLFPAGAKFRVTEFKTDRALRWMVRAKPVAADSTGEAEP